MVQKSLRSAESLRRTWGKDENLLQAGRNFSTKENSVAPASSGSFSAALRNNRKSINTTSSSVNPNAKFISTSTKPTGWIKTWYNLKTYLQKLHNGKYTTFLQQKKCWGCRNSSQYRSNKCYLLTNRKLNTTARTVEEVINSDTKIAQSLIKIAIRDKREKIVLTMRFHLLLLIVSKFRSLHILYKIMC